MQIVVQPYWLYGPGMFTLLSSFLSNLPEDAVPGNAEHGSTRQSCVFHWHTWAWLARDLKMYLLVKAHYVQWHTWMSDEHLEKWHVIFWSPQKNFPNYYQPCTARSQIHNCQYNFSHLIQLNFMHETAWLHIITVIQVVGEEQGLWILRPFSGSIHLNAWVFARHNIIRHLSYRYLTLISLICLYCTLLSWMEAMWLDSACGCLQHSTYLIFSMPYT